MASKLGHNGKKTNAPKTAATQLDLIYPAKQMCSFEYFLKAREKWHCELYLPKEKLRFSENLLFWKEWNFNRFAFSLHPSRMPSGFHA